MIIPNGYIRFIVKTAGGIDADGYPVVTTDGYTDYHPCQYVSEAMNLTASSSTGEARAAMEWSILLDTIPLTSERVELSRDDYSVIGTYSVKAVESLQAVSQIRLWV